MMVDISSSQKEEELKYDKEKYREMLLEATETVLGYFGFDRGEKYRKILIQSSLLVVSSKLYCCIHWKPTGRLSNERRQLHIESSI
jgi:hypothetical protein